MKIVRYCIVVLGCGAAMFLVAVATQMLFADRTQAQVFVIDPKVVVKRFVEERGNTMSDDDFKNAILEVDTLVLAEAQEIYSASGAMLINKNHILAGGVDVSAAFSDRVIARWDQWVVAQGVSQ